MATNWSDYGEKTQVNELCLLVVEMVSDPWTEFSTLGIANINVKFCFIIFVVFL